MEQPKEIVNHQMRFAMPQDVLLYVPKMLWMEQQETEMGRKEIVWVDNFATEAWHVLLNVPKMLLVERQEMAKEPKEIVLVENFATREWLALPTAQKKQVWLLE